MSAGTTHRDLVTAAAKRLTNYGVSASPIENNGVSDPLAPSLLGENVAHPTKISFALFANVAHENNVRATLDARISQRRRECQKRCDAGCIVAYTRAVQLVTVL